MSDSAVILLEKLKLQASLLLTERVEKFLRDEFRYKILPKIMKNIENDLIVDLVNDDMSLELTIRIKE